MLIAVILLLFCLRGYGQATEELIESSSSPEDAVEWLEYLRENPLVLTVATEEEIAQLPGLDLESAKRIRNYLDREPVIPSLTQMVHDLKLGTRQEESLHEFTSMESASKRSSRLISTAQHSESASETYSGSWVARVRYDLIADKSSRGFLSAWRRRDGEELFDDASAGLEVDGLGGRYRLYAGDFRFSHGTGLLSSGSAFGSGWTAQRDITPRLPTDGLKASPTTNERARFRGIGITLSRLFGQWSIAGGENLLSGRLNENGTSALTSTGDASSELERSRRGQIHERFWLGQGNVQWAQTEFAVAVIASQFDPESSVSSDTESAYELSGQSLAVGSISAHSHMGSVEVSLEGAHSQPGGGAVQGAVGLQDDGGALGAYISAADPDYYSVHGQSWSGFSPEAGNNRTIGLRGMTRVMAQEWFAHVYARKSPYRTPTSPLSKGETGAELRWHGVLSIETEADVLLARKFAENAGEDRRAVVRTSDRARVDIRWNGAPRLRGRFEIRSASYDDRSNSALGTIVSVGSSQPLWAWQSWTSLMAFHLENDDVSTSIYEVGLPGSYPLVSLAGDGMRAVAGISTAIRQVKVSGHAARQDSELHGERRTAWEAGISLSIRQ